MPAIRNRSWSMLPHVYSQSVVKLSDVVVKLLYVSLRVTPQAFHIFSQVTTCGIDRFPLLYLTDCHFHA